MRQCLVQCVTKCFVMVLLAAGCLLGALLNAAVGQTVPVPDEDEVSGYVGVAVDFGVVSMLADCGGYLVGDDEAVCANGQCSIEGTSETSFGRPAVEGSPSVAGQAYEERPRRPLLRLFRRAGARQSMAAASGG